MNLGTVGIGQAARPEFQVEPGFSRIRGDAQPVAPEVRYRAVHLSVDHQGQFPPLQVEERFHGMQVQPGAAQRRVNGDTVGEMGEGTEIAEPQREFVGRDIGIAVVVDEVMKDHARAVVAGIGAEAADFQLVALLQGQVLDPGAGTVGGIIDLPDRQVDVLQSQGIVGKVDMLERQPVELDAVPGQGSAFIVALEQRGEDP